MYQYFNGLVIREGTHGVPADQVEKLFQDAGWAAKTPDWQKEKFTLIFRNSTWAFTVWDQNDMVGMVRVISDQEDQGDLFAIVHVHTIFAGYALDTEHDFFHLSISQFGIVSIFGFQSANSFSHLGVVRHVGDNAPELGQRTTIVDFTIDIIAID